MWYTNCNGRREFLLEFLNSSKLKILNRGNRSTFCDVSRKQVIDITMGSYGLLESITGWEMFQEPSLSDYRHILFNLQGSVPAILIRNPSGTNWDSFREGLTHKLDRGPEMSMEDEAGLGLAVHWIQQAPITAYEGKFHLRPAKNGKINWTSELESVRREVTRLYNRSRADDKSSSWELFKAEI